MGCREGPRLGSECTVVDGRHVWQGQAGDKLGKNKVDGLHIGLRMEPDWKDDV